MCSRAMYDQKSPINLRPKIDPFQNNDAFSMATLKSLSVRVAQCVNCCAIGRRWLKQVPLIGHRGTGYTRGKKIDPHPKPYQRLHVKLTSDYFENGEFPDVDL